MECRLAVLERPDLVQRVGTALPALLFVIDREFRTGQPQPLQYRQIAEELSCGLSTIKKWMGDVEALGLVARRSCGNSRCQGSWPVSNS